MRMEIRSLSLCTSDRISGAGGGCIDWEWEMMPAMSYFSVLSGDVGGSVLWKGNGDGEENKGQQGTEGEEGFQGDCWCRISWEI